MPEGVGGAEVKPWAFLSEQKRGPEEPMSMSIEMQLYSMDEVPPAISPKGTYPPKEEKRSHIGGGHLTGFIRPVTPGGGRSSPQLEARMIHNTMEGLAGLSV